jgi:NAD-dependent deacetylase
MAELSREIDQAARLILDASYVVALVGAGMSVESGIPPFRGPGGLWTKYGEPDMRGYDRFLADPKGWWEARLSRDGYRAEFLDSLEQAKPNPGHHALAQLEDMGVLKHIITQNVDNLHYAAGSRNVAEIHGNMFKLRCIACNSRWQREEFSIKELPPYCPNCGGLVKSDGVMFGEPIPPDVLERCQVEAGKCDCMLLIGTSATVYPAAAFPNIVRSKGAPLVEINPLETTLSDVCNVVLRAPSAEVLPPIVERIKELFAQRKPGGG